MTDTAKTPGRLAERAILVVDDEYDCLDIIQRLLRHHGATVYSSQEGEEALQLAQAHQPHLIICDLTMAGMDGWSLLQALRSQPQTADLPVVALSAHVGERHRLRAMEAGFNDYLTKPVLPRPFIQDVLRILQQVSAGKDQPAQD